MSSSDTPVFSKGLGVSDDGGVPVMFKVMSVRIKNCAAKQVKLFASRNVILLVKSFGLAVFSITAVPPCPPLINDNHPELRYQCDTCTGFLLGGIGELNKKREPNFLVVDKNTSRHDIEETFRGFLKREDIAIILINQTIAEEIRYVIDSHNDPIPAVLEIPSKDSPYDSSKDSILRRAKVG
ncbi:hypothetical protein FSP39_009974 [Pinctada imbricata]|uniref:V-type proton ATPase subunit F n=1 Tax=Pinctada imbricata TaxID=66713 RepID=A0AA88YJG3_PINIB|nr:hypothetical protein FSP39_009974 [Pinctada imbricata]